MVFVGASTLNPESVRKGLILGRLMIFVGASRLNPEGVRKGLILGGFGEG